MTTDRLLLWSPRVLGLLLCVFLGLFAADAFGEGKPLAQALIDFAIHLLPSVLLLCVVAASWRREWLGGMVFIALAVAYATMMATRLEWILVVSGPLLLVGLLFLWSWRCRSALARPPSSPDRVIAGE
jgi:hypothetical protein